MNTINTPTFSSPFAQTYNSINDIPFRHNLDGVMITSTQCNTAPVVAALPRSSRKVVKRNAFKNSLPSIESVSSSSQ